MAVHPNGVPVSPVDAEVVEAGRSGVSRDSRPQTGTTAAQSPDMGPHIRATTLDKKGFLAQVRSISTSSFGPELGFRPDDERPAWVPTWLRPLPLLGIGALVLATACVFASLGILVGSKGQPTSDWTASPSVWIAIFTAISNRCIEFALVQALPISWWYWTSRGCTVRQLQQNWEAGQGVFRAIMNAKAMPLLAFATLMATLVAIDGPLLQKASSVESRTQTKPVLMQVQLSPEVPSGFSGYFDENGIETSHLAGLVLQDFLANSAITGEVSGCEGTCQATVQGPGVMIKNCSVHSWPITRDMLQNSTATWGSGYARRVAPMPVFTTQIYDTALHPGHNGPEVMELLVGMANYTNCSGQYVERVCTLGSAILEYGITISKGNIIAFTQSAGSQGRLLAPANNTHVDSSQDYIPLTITSLGAFLDAQITANASLEAVNSIDRENGNNISVPHQDSFGVFALQHAINSLACESQFRDPTDDILSQFNNLMFRGGLIAAAAANINDTAKNIDPGLNIAQSVAANETLTLNVYHSDLAWFAGAAVLEIIAILAVAPIFWGWWTLGVRVSFSPLSLANAFGAPLLKDINSASRPQGIVDKMGDVEVRYGATNELDYDVSMIETGKARALGPRTVSRLAIGKRPSIRKPVRGMRFDR